MKVIRYQRIPKAAARSAPSSDRASRSAAAMRAATRARPRRPRMLQFGYSFQMYDADMKAGTRALPLYASMASKVRFNVGRSARPPLMAPTADWAQKVQAEEAAATAA